MELSREQVTELISTLVCTTDLSERMVLGTRLQLHVATITKQAATLADVTKERDAADALVNKAERRIDALVMTEQALRQQLTDAQATIAQQRQEIDTLCGYKGRILREKADLQQRIEALESERDAEQMKRASAFQHAAELEDDKRTLQQSITSLKATIQRLEGEQDQEHKHFQAAWDEALKYKQRLATVEALLKELHAMVKGECPALLNEDSGGCARLDIAIEQALAPAPGWHRKETRNDE